MEQPENSKTESAHPVTQMQPPPLEILYITPYFGETLDKAIGFAPSVAADLCRVSMDWHRLAHADAVLFHIPNMKRVPSIPKAPGQLWVGMSMESDANYPLQSNPKFMSIFDLTFTYKSDADVRGLYFQPNLLQALQRAPVAKTEEAAAVYFASNKFALNNRFQIVEELLQFMKIDSYGKSQNNRALPESDRGRESKIDTLAKYKFYLAFENSNQKDYVSEKMFDGLVAGTIPVYLGAPNVDEFLPGENCIIKVSDFSTTQELAQYLLALAQDQNAYDSYFEWRRKPLKQSFMDLIEPEYTPSLRRLCQKLWQLKAAPPQVTA
ncbi:MAG TPA: glycosyltransferase family 10 [Planktothrix sp.]